MSEPADSEAMRLDGKSPCLEEARCKVRDGDDFPGLCDPIVHSCVTCGGEIHAICGEAALREEEEYARKRLSPTCSEKRHAYGNGEVARLVD